MTSFGVKIDDAQDECADECGECYRGKYPFSEPETTAIRDFLMEHKDEIKFSYNFHSYGNQWIYPFNGVPTNDLIQRNPSAYNIFNEFSDEVKFPESM